MIVWLIKLYRTVFCRGGYGVHSPFVFDLITTVIEERRLYYCYERLYPVRLQILQRQETVKYGQQMVTIKNLLKRYGFTEPEHRLLFRLANRFQPETMLTAGSDFGLIPLYLTAYSTGCACMVIEPERLTATIAEEYIEKYATASIDVRKHTDEIPDRLDFFVWGGHPFERIPTPPDFANMINLPVFDNLFTLPVFERLLLHIHEESVMVIAGINTSSENRNTWKAICAHPKVTVTLNLYRLGIVFFNPKLPKSTYKSVVL